MQLHGNVAGLSHAEHRRLSALTRRRVPPDRLVTQELAREMTEAARDVGRQVGVLLDRAGRVEVALVGDDHSVEIPDLGRGRAGAGRLLGLRLLHVHLKGEPLTRDDLTDLQLLRLDSVAVVVAREDGLPGAVHVAHLLPPNAEGRAYETLQWRAVSAVDLDPADLAARLEADMARVLRPAGARPVAAGGDRSFLVLLDLPGDGALGDRQRELRELARTAGLVVVDDAVQRRAAAEPRTVVGEGKLRDVFLASKQQGVDLIVFDRELTGSQARNVAELTDQRVIDRTQLILDIFARRATSREGKLQVELAQLRYLLPRLTGRGTALSRLAGGIGTRGPGESKLEMDRRRIRERIARLERDLAAVASGQGRRRSRRERTGVPVVSLVGYTNAGKSSLLNRLTRSREHVEDRLFATLDPRSRRLRLPREREILVTDTVGFIRDLPPELRRAFGSTLAEMEDADLLLHVVDAGAEGAEDRLATVERLIDGLGLGGVPNLRVFNQRDRDPARADVLAARHAGLAVSALTGDGLGVLVEEVVGRLQAAGAWNGTAARGPARRRDAMQPRSDDVRIEHVQHDQAAHPPPPDLAARAGALHVGSLEEWRRLHQRAVEDPEAAWAEAAELIPWMRPFDRVLDGGFPDARWFDGGLLNACHVAVTRQVETGHGDEVALVWEGEPALPGGPEVRKLTYRDVDRETSRLAAGLRSLGVAKGAVVTIYMGMVPEVVVAMLACARLGAAHSVIFGGFSAQAIADRVEDAESRVVVTCDGAWRRGAIVPLKENVDAAARVTSRIERVVVLRRTGQDVAWTEGRDTWWHDLVEGREDDLPCVPVASEDVLFLLYTSGSTGKPKGIVHSTAGYLVQAAWTARLAFNLRPDRGQLYWCTADVGWVTGHTYVVYGILPSRVPTLLYEGAPNFPGPDRFWDIVERHRVTQLYTAPTAIRAFMKWGDEQPRAHDLSSLVILGTVGEPINPEAWNWYHEVIGGGRCPIVDTWWQTETGGHAITPLPGATPLVPGSATLPFPGIDAAVVDERGEELPANVGGLLVIRRPWPAMLRGIHRDRQRYLDTYFARVPGCYLAGDAARRDEGGYFWIMGRIDDVIKVSGHRLGTAEIESSLVGHEAVVEAAVVGVPDEATGNAVVAFVTLGQGFSGGADLAAALREHVARDLGAVARPKQVRFADALPKTRSGKIMRRLLRDVAAGRDCSQDTTTLEDLAVLARLRQDDEG